MRYTLIVLIFLFSPFSSAQELVDAEMIAIMESNSDKIELERQQICTPTTLEFLAHGPYIASGSGHYIHHLLNAGKISAEQAASMYQVVANAIESAVYTSCSHAVRYHWARSAHPEAFEVHYKAAEERMEKVLDMPRDKMQGLYYPPIE